MAGWVVRIVPKGFAAQELSRRLREGEPPVVGRVEDEAVLLDLRTVHPDQDAALAEALRAALEHG